MDQDHINHLNKIIEEFTVRATDTYIRGQREHGGNLWEKDNLPEAVEESIDMFIYLITELERSHRKDQLIAELKEHIKTLEEMLAGMQG